MVNWDETATRLRSGDPSIKSMMIVGIRFSEVPRDVLDALSTSTNVQNVHFQMGSMTDEDCETLQGTGLPIAHALHSLHLSRNSITSRGLAAVAAAALSPISTLVKLNLNDTQCRDGVVGMAHALCEAPVVGRCPLRTLELHGNGIDGVARRLLRSWPRSPRLASASCCWARMPSATRALRRWPAGAKPPTSEGCPRARCAS